MDRYQFAERARAVRDNVVLVLVLIAFALWSTGCATNSHERVEGWPELEIVEHHVAHNEMRNRCNLYVAFGQAPEACAEFSFSTARCDIWFSADFPPASYVVTHERQHCVGFDHTGSTAMRDALAAYLLSLKGQ